MSQSDVKFIADGVWLWSLKCAFMKSALSNQHVHWEKLSPGHIKHRVWPHNNFYISRAFFGLQKAAAFNISASRWFTVWASNSQQTEHKQLTKNNCCPCFVGRVSVDACELVSIRWVSCLHSLPPLNIQMFACIQCYLQCNILCLLWIGLTLTMLPWNKRFKQSLQAPPVVDRNISGQIQTKNTQFSVF